MIARTQPRLQPAPWQRELADGYRRPADLLAALGLDPALPGIDLAADNPFPQRVPRSYVRRMRPGDPDDPLLRQVLPLRAERAPQPAGFREDPVGDRAAARTPGLLSKYRGRALLITTGACAIHCRYCFRRHFPYAEAARAEEAWPAALAALAEDEELTEVILSGGDPLSLPDARLAALVEQLERLPRLRRLRVHTRLPVVLPSRVDAPLLRLLEETRLQVVFVIHANHPAEMDGAVARAMGRLAAAGATLLNQSVLLRGVNDDAGTLAGLSEALFEAGVAPYYLHLLDPVAGAAHFDVPEAEARVLHQALQARLPGYLVPRLAREEAGAAAKTLIA